MRLRQFSKNTMKILVINGPNINMLGIREPGIYGSESYQALIELIQKTAKEDGIEIECYQSNQQAYGVFHAIVINPAAYTHTSVAILDALKAVMLPAVEVHISDVSKREDFRQISYPRLACVKTIIGEGINGYVSAIKFLEEYVR